jgi:hypothetical protein
LTKREIKPVTANQIKELGPGLCADVQQILKPLRDQKGGPFSFSFQPQKLVEEECFKANLVRMMFTED